MKIRNGFVSNSSSSSFIITNKTDKDLTLIDFVIENHYLVQDYLEEYDWNKRNHERYTLNNMIECAKNRNDIFEANSSKEYIYGDEDGDLIGDIYDYMLRNGGNSKSFKWKFYKYYR